MPIILSRQIEEPVDLHNHGDSTPEAGTNVLPDYDTIGHFYDGILEGWYPDI